MQCREALQCSIHAWDSSDLLGANRAALRFALSRWKVRHGNRLATTTKRYGTRIRGCLRVGCVDLGNPETLRIVDPSAFRAGMLTCMIICVLENERDHSSILCSSQYFRIVWAPPLNLRFSARGSEAILSTLKMTAGPHPVCIMAAIARLSSAQPRSDNSLYHQ